MVLRQREPALKTEDQREPEKKERKRYVRKKKGRRSHPAARYEGLDGKRGDSLGGIIRPSDALTAAFFIPVVIMIIVFAQRGIFPFGDKSFLRTDMYHQYAPFFSEFQYKLTHGGSLLYSWDVGMGVNFSALFAYYLASPLNWLIVLCPKDYVIEFMTYSVVLKIGLSGLSMAYYLRKHNKTSDFGVAFFGIFYALSGYMAAYSWNIMWLDCILLFPLIVLGLERLVHEKKCYLYCITLGIAILSNYYISIMICIFMVMYFIALLILERKDSWKYYWRAFLRFAFFSLVAGGLAAAVLLPEVYALQATASGNFSFPKTFDSYFPIFDMLARHIGNVETEIGLNHWPNIYCGIAVYIFFLLYLACRKVEVKEKAVYCGLLLFFFASFSTNILNFVWHGFHYPNSLPCRQSFVYIFLMLFVCYRAYMNIKSFSKKEIAVAFWGSICFVLLAEKLVTQEHFHFSVYYVAILFLAAYAGLLYWYHNPKYSKTVVIMLSLAVVSIEAAVNTAVTSVTTTSRTSYMRDNKATIALTAPLGETEIFYRIDKTDQRTKNDGAWMNFPTVSLFSSTANADLTQFFKWMGCESSTNAYSIHGSTPLVDSLVSVKYSLYPEIQPLDEKHVLIGQEDEVYLYENQFTLPLGFYLEPDFEQRWQYDMGNPVEVQNSLCDILNAPYVLIENPGELKESSYRFTAGEQGEYFAYVNNKKIETVTAVIDEKSQNFTNVNRGYLLPLGYLDGGSAVTLRTDQKGEEFSVKVYRFDTEGLKSIYQTLNQSPFTLNSRTDTEVTGTLDAPEAGVLFTSIPYDKGWRVTMDGQPAETRKVLDTFLGIDVSAGHHEIRLSYEPEGLRLGLAITGASIAVLVLIWLAGYMMKSKKTVTRAGQPFEE